MAKCNKILPLILSNLFFYLVTPKFSYSQNDKISDAALWSGIQINQNLPGKWVLSYEYQSRFTRNISFHRGHFQFLSLTWKPLEYFNATLEYRNVLAFDGNTNRLGLELNLKKKWGRFQIIKRTAIQRDYYYLNLDQQPSGFPTDFWRERILFRYELSSRWKCIFSVESFFTVMPQITFRRLRTQTGVSFDATKKMTFSGIWLYQEEFNIPNPDITHAWVLGASIDLPNWWKKKKKDKQKAP
jgi:hypothetical protein